MVVNHHLPLPTSLRDEGMAELLPACNTVILDEAHQLPETATLSSAIGPPPSRRAGTRQPRRRPRCCGVICGAAGSANKLKSPRASCLAVGRGRAAPAQAVQRQTEFATVLSETRARLAELAALLETQAERSDGLDNCCQRALDLRHALDRWCDAQAAEHLIRWVEIFTQSLQMHATPLKVSDLFRKQLEQHKRAWIFTSATLSVKGDFSHYQSELGLEQARTASWESPFDFQHQALLYVPKTS